MVVSLAAALLLYAGFEIARLPVDVFPDLNRPRVTVITEALGLAPEEVETLITVPLETVLNGATGVQTVRSASGIGLSLIYVEFGWGTDIYKDRQIVAERLNLARNRLPAGILPQMAPISSLMGQIQHVGMWSEGSQTDPIEVRTLADWVVRLRLLSIPGVAQVITMGGGRKQYQVRVNPDALLTYDVTLRDIEVAVGRSNANATGGYLNLGNNEFLVRSLGRVRDEQDLRQVVVRPHPERPVLLHQVANIMVSSQVKRGDSAVNGSPAVILTILKQPGTDTRALTRTVTRALDDLKSVLPGDIRLDPGVYQQRTFIELGIENVVEAVRDGSLLVIVMLFLFLLNVRATFIVLTAIPLSIAATALVFAWCDLSINIMTLGGLAIGVSDMVDAAIVIVENVLRRLRDNRTGRQPQPVMTIVLEACAEVRGAILFSTFLVVLSFLPLLALSGLEGRLFTPLAIAYLVSILASLAVSVTVTPVLAYWLLSGASQSSPRPDPWALRHLKRLAGMAIRFSLRSPRTVLATGAMFLAVSVVVLLNLGRDFLPPFNEGTMQLNVLTPPGTSLAASNRIAAQVDDRLQRIRGVVAIGRRTGRAELDEHAEGVNVSEIIISFDSQSGRHREEMLQDIREQAADVPGVLISVDQPLSHLISHMLSGVRAKVGVKLFGDDLLVLRAKASEIYAAMSEVDGVKDLQVEPQIEVPQLQIRLNRAQLAFHGLNTQDVNDVIQTAMQGQVVSEVVLGQRKFDLLVRLDDEYREDPVKLRRLPINLPTGGKVGLEVLADIQRTTGPNTINRENGRRRIVIQCNTAGRDLLSVITDIQARLAPLQKTLPIGSYIEYGGQFESQQSATRLIGLFSAAALAGMFLALYSLYRSANLALHVLASPPMAAVGAVAGLILTNQSLTIASLVGMITLVGISSRNGILMISHYLHLMAFEGEQFTPAMIERAGQERVASLLATALIGGFGLVPLVLEPGQPGKELLYPIGVVILGGLISTTLLDFLIRPALFWCYGRQAAEASLKSNGRLADLSPISASTT